MNKQLQIIALAGTNGSGKDSVGQILSEYHNFVFISVTDLLRDELKKRGEPITRENLRKLSSEWRTKHGLGVLVDLAMDSFAGQTADAHPGLVIASLRNSGEVERVHELGGEVLWVDADPRVRYERVQANAGERGRAGEDNKSYEQFISEEQAEMNRLNDSDETTLNMSKVKQLSDIFIYNNKTDISNLRTTIEKALDL